MDFKLNPIKSCTLLPEQSLYVLTSSPTEANPYSRHTFFSEDGLFNELPYKSVSMTGTNNASHIGPAFIPGTNLVIIFDKSMQILLYDLDQGFQCHYPVCRNRLPFDFEYMCPYKKNSKYCLFGTKPQFGIDLQSVKAKKLLVLNLATLKVAHVFNIPLEGDTVIWSAFSEDYRYLASGSEGKFLPHNPISKFRYHTFSNPKLFYRWPYVYMGMGKPKAVENHGSTWCLHKPIVESKEIEYASFSK